MLKKTLSCLLFLCFGCCTFAQSIKIAAAANLQAVIKALDADFTAKTGIKAEPIIASSGNLVTQIKNGAPFDVFLSADMAFPAGLHAAGLTIGKPTVYALGSLIVCSNQHVDVKHWQQLILKNTDAKIAVANPAIAPYGKAAVESLTKLALYGKVQSRLVTGESISQVNTYITTGNVVFGFTSLSFIKEAGNMPLSWVLVDKKLYNPIEQGMVILKYGQQNNPVQAQKFYNYLLSASAKAILIKYGYIVP